jgi:hypothetical protein
MIAITLTGWPCKRRSLVEKVESIQQSKRGARRWQYVTLRISESRKAGGASTKCCERKDVSERAESSEWRAGRNRSAAMSSNNERRCEGGGTILAHAVDGLDGGVLVHAGVPSGQGGVLGELLLWYQY